MEALENKGGGICVRVEEMAKGCVDLERGEVFVDPETMGGVSYGGSHCDYKVGGSTCAGT